SDRRWSPPGTATSAHPAAGRRRRPFAAADRNSPGRCPRPCPGHGAARRHRRPPPGPFPAPRFPVPAASGVRPRRLGCPRFIPRAGDYFFQHGAAQYLTTAHSSVLQRTHTMTRLRLFLLPLLLVLACLALFRSALTADSPSRRFPSFEMQEIDRTLGV